MLTTKKFKTIFFSSYFCCSDPEHILKYHNFEILDYAADKASKSILLHFYKYNPLFERPLIHAFFNSYLRPLYEPLLLYSFHAASDAFFLSAKFIILMYH